MDTARIRVSPYYYDFPARRAAPASDRRLAAGMALAGLLGASALMRATSLPLAAQEPAVEPALAMPVPSPAPRAMPVAAETIAPLATRDSTTLTYLADESAPESPFADLGPAAPPPPLPDLDAAPAQAPAPAPRAFHALESFDGTRVMSNGGAPQAEAAPRPARRAWPPPPVARWNRPLAWIKTNSLGYSFR